MKMYTLKDMLLVAALCLAASHYVDSTEQVMKDMSISFTKALSACKQEMDLPDSINADFNNFWKEEHALTSRDTGCAIMCLSSKLDLVDPELNLHHGNAKEFALKHGADEDLASDLVNIFHECGMRVKQIQDKCLMVLEWAKCFKVGVHEKGIAPSMELIVAEVLAGV